MKLKFYILILGVFLSGDVLSQTEIFLTDSTAPLLVDYGGWIPDSHRQMYLDARLYAHKVYNDSISKLLLKEIKEVGDGFERIHYWPNGHVKTVEIFISVRDQRIHDISEDYYYCEDGTLILHRTNLDNNLGCELRESFCNGKKKLYLEKFMSKSYMPKGKFRTWHPYGKLKIKGKFENGEYVGTWKYYNEDGSILRIENY